MIGSIYFGWLGRRTQKKKKKTPYEAHELYHYDMLDLKALADHLITNRLINTEGEKVNWLKIKILRYEKKYPFVIQYKYITTLIILNV